MLLSNHVAEVDPDTQLDAPLLGHIRLAFDHPALDLDGTPDGVHHARKLGQETVAGVLYDPAPMLCDLWIDEFTEVNLQMLVGALLVR